MDDNINLIFHVNLTDIDLNQEPAVQSVLNQLDSAQERVEADEERQLHDQNPIGIHLFPVQTTASDDNDRSTLDGTNNIGIVQGKPDGSHLVAKGLEINSEISKADKDRGSFYDCNICLDMASDPVLTCCGHLFCWPCLYQFWKINSTSKECPVCKVEVSENTLTPIYGNSGETERVLETELGLRIPPRPSAHRVESIRQQMVTHGLNEHTIEEAIMQIRASLGETVGPGTRGGEVGDNMDNDSGFFPENSDSLSSLSWVLSGADRLIEELEMVISRRDDAQALGGPELPVGHPYSLRGRRRRRIIVPRRELGEGGRRRRLN